MELFALFAVCWFGAQAVEFGEFTRIAGDEQECGACALTGTIDYTGVTDCLRRVPDSCQYTITGSGAMPAPAVCLSAYGLDLKGFLGSLDFASIVSLAGSATLFLEGSDQSCEFTYHFSDDEFCVAKPSGAGATLTSQDGSIAVDLATLSHPKLYMNLEATGPECGTCIANVEYTNPTSVLLVKGSKGVSTPGPVHTTYNPNEGTGASLRQVSLALALLVFLLPR
eukprot:Gregarina_sp_Pseudo_9__5453@NODE_687_length_2363_cov_40_265921_g650_i0_p2_GENE_NODE_687_length_2363_cov_40_265921_g650_i0NODE_687_length_2363_cov_40_265921_g650_i0_p2_ORF_typecomplete_len225_score32_42zfCHCC/PF10276_9/0_032_NODE_687_length_2363_cov_40_265921_g650_i06711345